MGIPIISEILTVILDAISKIWDTIPKPLKFGFFLAILLFGGNVISDFTVGTSYACKTDGSLMQFDGYGEAVSYGIDLAFFGEGVRDNYLSGNLSSIEHNNWLLVNSQGVYVSDDMDFMKVSCVKDYNTDLDFYNARFTIGRVDPFSYILWLFGALIWIIVVFFWKYNDQMFKN